MAGILVGLVLERFPARDTGELCVALTLADAADVDGSNVYPSVARVARLARCSERAVQYALARFKEVGFLKVVSLGGGRGRPTKYRIDREWLESQQSVLPDANGAQGAPISETMQKPCNKGAKKAQKGCTNGAPACAPNPPPVDSKPPTPNSNPENPERGVVGSEDKRGRPVVENLDELVEAALLAAKRSSAAIRSESAWRASVRKRLAEKGPTAEDVAALTIYRRQQAGVAMTGSFEDGLYKTSAGTLMEVRDESVYITLPDGRSEVQPLSFLTNGQIALTRVGA